MIAKLLKFLSEKPEVALIWSGVALAVMVLLVLLIFVCGMSESCIYIR